MIYFFLAITVMANFIMSYLAIRKAKRRTGTRKPARVIIAVSMPIIIVVVALLLLKFGVL